MLRLQGLGSLGTFFHRILSRSSRFLSCFFFHFLNDRDCGDKGIGFDAEDEDGGGEGDVVLLVFLW